MLTPQSTYADLKGFFPFEPTEDQDVLLKKLALYLSVKRIHPEVLIVKGYAGTGKTTVLRSVVAAHKKHQRKIVLMAPTGRAAKVMSGAAGKNAFTIHRSLYRPSVSNGGVANFVLSNNPHKNTTFVVDEAGLVATNNDSTLGGNSLLEDLLTYVFSDPSNGLVLVGDPAQLPPVGQPQSPALSSDWFIGAGINATEHTLRMVVRQALDSHILKNATQLRELIESDSSEPPKLIPGEDFIQVEDGYHLQEIFEQLYASKSEGNTMVVRSNKKANNYNQGIRGRIKFQEDQISAGDQFMVVRNNYFWLPETSKMGFIANGEIGEVRSIRNVHERYGLTFCEATVVFVDYPSEDAIDVILNLSTLSSEGPALSSAQSNALYEQMLAKFSYLSSKKKIYEAIKNDPYYNALQVKFSYVITCHKSQGGQWEQVIIEHPYLPDGPSPIYFKWLYTALTRASQKAYLLGFPPDWFDVSQQPYHSTMKYIISRVILGLIGWKVVAPEEIRKKARNTVTIAAPHTSNFDTFLALGTFWQMRLPMKFLIKDFYTKWYFFGFFTWLGAIGVNRDQRSNLVATSAKLMKEGDINLIVSPEGTRSYAEKWKSGFYYIAKDAGDRKSVV